MFRTFVLVVVISSANRLLSAEPAPTPGSELPRLVSISVEQQTGQEAAVAKFTHHVEFGRSYRIEIGGSATVMDGLQAPSFCVATLAEDRQSIQIEPREGAPKEGGRELCYQCEVPPFVVEYFADEDDDDERLNNLDARAALENVLAFDWPKGVRIDLHWDRLKIADGRLRAAAPSRSQGYVDLYGVDVRKLSGRIIHFADPSRFTDEQLSSLYAGANAVRLPETLAHVQLISPQGNVLPRGTLMIRGTRLSAQIADTPPHVRCLSLSYISMLHGRAPTLWFFQPEKGECYADFELDGDILKYKYSDACLFFKVQNPTTRRAVIRFAGREFQVAPRSVGVAWQSKEDMEPFVDDPVDFDLIHLEAELDRLAEPPSWLRPLVIARREMAAIEINISKTNSQIYLLKSRQALYLGRGGSNETLVTDYNRQIAAMQAARRKLDDDYARHQLSLAYRLRLSSK